tara:strand:- start:9895 stop:10290 length:396 start_codon:yes stop_codon:yes gene_type:complete
MSSYNKIILMGNLTQDPVLSYLPSQTPVCEFGLATNRKWTNADGTKKEDVCFVDCKAFGITADNINKYFAKGKPILVEGRLAYDTWKAKDGSKRSKHRVMIERFEFINDGSGGQRESQESQPVATPDDVPF